MWSKVRFSRPTLISLTVFASSSMPRRTSDWTKKKKAAENSTMGSMCPPINITVLPAGSSQQSIHPPANDAMPTGPDCTESIMVDGLLDVAVDEYTEWQKLRVSNETFAIHN